MKKIVLICLSFLFLLVSSCKNKTKEPPQNEKWNVAKIDSTLSQKVYSDTEEEEELRKPYPAEIHGIWGNTTYYDYLKKYNSIGKSLENMKFDNEIKINSTLALVMRPQYMEPVALDTIKYALLKGGIDSLYVRSRNTGEKQLFLKLISLPDTILWSLYEDDEYSAISRLEWRWFCGKYELTNSFGGKINTEFFADGTVSGTWQYQFYSFGIDVDGKDFLYMRSHDDEHIYFLIEYQPNGDFICYNVENTDDWEYPFIKKSLAFTLRRTND